MLSIKNNLRYILVYVFEFTNDLVKQAELWTLGSRNILKINDPIPHFANNKNNGSKSRNKLIITLI